MTCGPLIGRLCISEGINRFSSGGGGGGGGAGLLTLPPIPLPPLITSSRFFSLRLRHPEHVRRATRPTRTCPQAPDPSGSRRVVTEMR